MFARTCDPIESNLAAMFTAPAVSRESRPEPRLTFRAAPASPQALRLADININGVNRHRHIRDRPGPRKSEEPATAWRSELQCTKPNDLTREQHPIKRKEPEMESPDIAGGGSGIAAGPPTESPLR